MTEINKDDVKKNAMEETRLKRRSILKAGAVIAPLAVTLHGGIPLAHAASTGCVQELVDNVTIPVYENGSYNMNNMVQFNPNAYTGLIENGESESHWDYLIDKKLYGASCMTSIISTGLTVNYTP